VASPSDTSPASTAPDQRLLDDARGGDEAAFGRLVAPHQRELHAHCYRMLGSLHDAEDAVQETLLRAWRAIPKFGGDQLLRPWLYKIATNVSLDAIAKRPKRVMPAEHVEATDPEGGPVSTPVIETVWVEPYPDETLGVENGYAGPEASYEQREAVELAFIAALQHLPANQRAVLITREVLGYSAKEVADLLDTSVQSVNSALQRARKTVDEKLPDQSQQQTLRALGDDGMREVVEGYMDAMSRGDVNQVVSMLAEDAVWSMPPLDAWFGGPEGGHESLRGFLVGGPLSGEFRWKHLPARTNGQLAIGSYAWVESERAFLPFALDTLAVTPEGKIQEVTSFIVRTTDLPPEAFAHWPHHPIDPKATEAVFGRAGLPAQLD
jgi:RNA polymerase sigma-70 factor (ECF subfamily)